MSLTQLAIFTTMLIGSIPIVGFWISTMHKLAPQQKPTIRIAFASTAVLLAAASTWHTYELHAEPDFWSSGEFLIGEWEVFNDDELDLYAEWTFLRGRPDQVLVQGDIYSTRVPRTLGKVEQLKHEIAFGPYPISRSDDGHFRFDYDVEGFGKGVARFEVTEGMIGSYGDNAALTATDEVDEGRIAFHRERSDLEAVHLRRTIQAAFSTMLWAWIASGISWIIYRRIEQATVSRSATLRLALAFAVLALIYLPGGSLLAARQNDLRLTAAAISGPWTMDYLVDRSRMGHICIGQRGENQLALSGELFLHHKAVEEVPAAPGVGRAGRWRGSMESRSAAFDETEQRFDFSYGSVRGSGAGTLVVRPTLIGHFIDANSEPDQAMENVGKLIAIKKPGDRG